MSDNNIKRQLLFIIIVLVSIASVNAAENFKAYQGENPSGLCPGTTGLITDIVENIGSYDLDFTINNAGSASSFSTTVPSGFTLKPGQKRTIYSYVSPRTTTSIGSFDLDIIANANGETELITHNFDLKNCFQYNLEAVQQSQQICPGETARFNFKLRNVGDFSDTFLIAKEGQLSDSITLSDEQITLAKGESKDLFAYVNAGSDITGDFDFTITVKGLRGKSVQSINGKLIVNACYDYSLKSDKNYISLCEHSSQLIPIQIKNDGSVTNNYNLQLEGESWMSIDQAKITLASGESKTVGFIVNPDYGINGDYRAIVKAISEKGNVEQTSNYDVNVRSCYGAVVDIEKDQDKICSSLSNKYNVLIKNTGDFDQDYRFSIDGPTWALIDQSRININAGGEGQVTLEINPGIQDTGEFDVKVNIEALDSSKTISSDSIKVMVVSREECYQPAIGINNKDITVNYDSSTTVPVVIENKGSNTATYTIAVTGTASSFVQLNPATISVDPGKAELVYLYAAPNIETPNGQYSATVSVRLGDSTILASDTINILVSESKAVEEVTPTPEVEKQPGFFARLWQSIFGKKENVTEQPEEEVPEETEELPEENVTEEVPVEEIPEEEPTIPEEQPEENVTQEVPEEQPEVPETTEEISNLDKIGTKTTNIKPGGEEQFIINDEEHKIRIDKFENNTLSVIISSDPVFVEIKAGESKDVDTDGDGINDVRVTFLGYVNGEANVIYEKIGFTAPTEEVTEQKGPGFFSLYRNYIIIALILLVLLIILIRTKAHKRMIDFFEEEIEEEEFLQDKKEVKEEKKEIKHEEKKEVKVEKKEEKKVVKKEEKKISKKKDDKPKVKVAKDEDEDDYY